MSWSSPVLHPTVEQYRKNGLVYYRVANAYCTGTVHQQGAHVTEYSPGMHKPVLWMSELSNFEPGKPFRGGIPICFPWFGKGPNGDMEPLHGPVRIANWQLEKNTLNHYGETKLVFYYSEPEMFILRYSVVFGSALTTTLEIKNSSTKNIHSYEAMLHNYFAVKDAQKTYVTGLGSVPYLNRINNEQTQGEPTATFFNQRIDRLYNNRNTLRISDTVNNRIITTDCDGMKSTCLWNPGPDMKFDDIKPDGWKDFVCVENGNASDQIISLQPGSTCYLKQTISVV